MKIKPAIRTMPEIEQIVSSFSGTWVRRKNAEKKLILWSNELVNTEIELIKSRVRLLKAQGLYEADFRSMYSDITQLELRLL